VIETPGGSLGGIERKHLERWRQSTEGGLRIVVQRREPKSIAQRATDIVVEETGADASSQPPRFCARVERDIENDPSVADLRGVAADVVAAKLATPGRKIEFPVVPRAGEHAVHHRALRQGVALMGASVFQNVELAAPADTHQPAIAELAQRRFPLRKVRQRSQLEPFGCHADEDRRGSSAR
jgi:hypothetical protein